MIQLRRPVIESWAKFHIISLMAGGFTLIIPNEAHACAICELNNMMALLDLFLTPVRLWILFAISWFLAVSHVATRRGKSIMLVPMMPYALIFVGLMFVMSVMVSTVGFMPFFSLFFVLVYPLVTIRALVGRIIKKYDIHGLWSITLVGILVFVLLLINNITVLKSRSQADFILKWKNAMPAKIMLNQITSSGTKHISDLRILVEKGDPPISTDAAFFLGNIGDPDIDIPLLARQLEKCRQNLKYECDKSILEHFQRSLKKLEGKKVLEKDVKLSNYEGLK